MLSAQQAEKTVRTIYDAFPVDSIKTAFKLNPKEYITGINKTGTL